jgi:hypothetical protein
MSIGGFYLLVAMVGTANGGLMVLLTPMLQRWVQVNHRALSGRCIVLDIL